MFIYIKRRAIFSAVEDFDLSLSNSESDGDGPPRTPGSCALSRWDTWSAVAGMDGGDGGVEAVLLLALPDFKLLKTRAIPPAT